jgi:ABC-type transporter Mla subunit MlaD
MNKSRLEWKVGLFVFIGLALLAGLLLQFSKGTTFFRPTYRILLRAQSAGGLKLRSVVLMAGVQIGTVSDVSLGTQGTNVIITLKIYSTFEVHKDARFAIESSGFLGDQYIAIIPTLNQKPMYQDGDSASAEAPFNLQEVARSAAGFITHIDETAHNLNAAIADIRRLVLNENTLTNLSVSVANLRVISEKAVNSVDSLNQLIAANQPWLAESGSNFVAFSARLNGVANGVGDLIATNSPDIRDAVKNIDSATVVLKTMADDLHAGKGLAGSLIANEQLAADVARIASNLSITSSNLNRLGLWGILWQHKLPKTNAPPSGSDQIRSPKDSTAP